MVRLRLLGGAVVRLDGRLITGRAAQQHNLALLAFLAVSPGQTATRDKLIGHLWPDRDAARGRHRLSVALHVVRKALGADCLRGHGDAITLDAERVRIDAVEFADAAAAGRLEEAVELYAGCFLDGFYLGCGGEFDRWVEEERGRLADLFRNCLERLAEEAEARGDQTAAVERWRKLVAHSPYSGPIAIRLIRSLAAGGDVANALFAARAHMTAMATELEIPPDPEVVQLAHSLAEEAARRDAEAEDPPKIPVPAPAEPGRADASTGSDQAPAITPDTAHDGVPPTRNRRWRRRAWLLGAALAAALAAVVLPLGEVDPAGQPATDTGATLAVLPFVTEPGSSDLSPLADAITSELVRTLGYIPRLEAQPMSDEAAESFRESASDAARALGADYGLGGGLREDDGLIVLEAALHRADSEDRNWRQTYRTSPGPAAAVAKELSLAISLDLRLRLVPYEPDHYTVSDAANQAFLSGVFEHRRLTAERLWIALQHYRRAWEDDPDFALAHAIAGVAYISLSNLGIAPEVGWEFARDHITRALEIDPDLAEGYSSLGQVQFRWDHDFEAADESFRRAMMIYPTHPDSHTEYGYFLMYVLGRGDAAVASVERALELDPLNTARSRTVEAMLYHSRRYEEAVRQNRHTWSLDADVARTLAVPLGNAYREMGMHDESVIAFQEMHERRGGATPPGLAVTYARMGRTEDARRILNERKANAAEGGRGAVGIARIHANLHEPDSALVWLQRAFESDRPALLTIATDPALDPLRSDPRFRDLIQRMGLAREAIRADASAG